MSFCFMKKVKNRKKVKLNLTIRRVGLMPWADVRLNTDANFETAEVKEKEGEENRVPIPPFGWYRWANDNEEETPKREGNKLRLPPIKDGRKISYISFVITEEEMEEKENETKDEKEKGEKIENEEKRTEEEECDEDIFSRSLAPTTFRFVLKRQRQRPRQRQSISCSNQACPCFTASRHRTDGQREQVTSISRQTFKTNILEDHKHLGMSQIVGN